VDRRILLLITDLKIGGTPTVVRDLARRLAQEPGVTVHVACLDHWGPVADQIQTAGVDVTVLNACCSADIRIPFRLATLIKDQRLDTLFSFLIHANAMAALARIRFPQIRFFQSIQTTQPKPRWHWWLQRICQRAAGKIVVPSPSIAEAAIRWAAVPREKIVVIPNAVDLANSSREHAKRGKSVGFIGRLDPIKRVGDLIESLAILDSDVSLHIFGDGEDRARIERDINRLNLTGRVKLHGSIPNPWDALASLDVLVLPSLTEGFGLVLLEAMAAGVPIVATDVPGIRDIVIHHDNGLLVPPKNPPALAAAIGQVLSDFALRDRLVARGRETVLERFTWESVYPQYRKLLL
jgi:glycosyltransferase involved in cell wall biosynthesis